MIAHWGWPQFIYATLLCMGLGYSLAMHGKPREPHNAVAHIIAAIVAAGLLYAGGFWS